MKPLASSSAAVGLFKGAPRELHASTQQRLAVPPAEVGDVLDAFSHWETRQRVGEVLQERAVPPGQLAALWNRIRHPRAQEAGRAAAAVVVTGLEAAHTLSSFRPQLKPVWLEHLADAKRQVALGADGENFTGNYLLTAEVYSGDARGFFWAGSFYVTPTDRALGAVVCGRLKDYRSRNDELAQLRRTTYTAEEQRSLVQALSATVRGNQIFDQRADRSYRRGALSVVFENHRATAAELERVASLTPVSPEEKTRILGDAKAATEAAGQRFAALVTRLEGLDFDSEVRVQLPTGRNRVWIDSRYSQHPAWAALHDTNVIADALEPAAVAVREELGAFLADQPA